MLFAEIVCGLQRLVKMEPTIKAMKVPFKTLVIDYKH